MEWWKAELAKIDKDPLLRWIKDARDGDIHSGGPGLASSAYTRAFTAPSNHPSQPDAVFVMDHDGAYWEWPHRGRMKREYLRTAEIAVRMVAADAPEKHLGVVLANRDPVTLCDLALSYYEGLGQRAEAAFLADDRS